MALKCSRGMSFHFISGFITWCGKKLAADKESVSYSDALTENAFKNQTAKFIVYGHTHHHEIQPLRVSCVGDNLFKQIYLNSGTWRQVYEEAMADPNKQEFVGYKVMTYLAFYKKDEHRGQSFEAWSGSFGG